MRVMVSVTSGMGYDVYINDNGLCELSRPDQWNGLIRFAWQWCIMRVRWYTAFEYVKDIQSESIRE